MVFDKKIKNKLRISPGSFWEKSLRFDCFIKFFTVFVVELSNIKKICFISIIQKNSIHKIYHF